MISELLLSICLVESSGNVKAIHFDDGGVGNHSVGFCQVGIETARQLGMKGDWRQLFVLKTNLLYAQKYLDLQLERYSGDVKKAVSAYNAGTAISKNWKYVQKVMKYFQEESSLKRKFRQVK